ncbi:flagellar protein FlgN [Paenibacillus ginsengarvi]|uniref:Flagellar protein FlgN n=1 Tax=Paenibacillus ginsengarvi TaxID=400777 RepID=A0A3B0BYW0_9BACL|nr:flagellar protein FlgN [Paenibacillus ginsengarvi]RKN78875.1 flagellar protein FlgN [Paenibacillus ginsengarvi]
MDAVLQTLERQLDVHRLLLELSEKKRHIIIDNDVEKLMQITQKEGKLIRLAEQLEAERAEAVQAYMRSRNMYVTSAITIQTLSKIATRLEEKQTLAERREELLSLMERLKQANELNRQLIEHSLAFIDYSLNLFLDNGSQEAVYQHPLQEHSAYQANSLFDRKA